MIQSLQTASDCLVAAQADYDSAVLGLTAQVKNLQSQFDTLQVQQPPALFTPTVWESLQKRTDWSRGADVAGLDGTWSRTTNPDGSVWWSVAPTSAYNNFYTFVNLESGTRDLKSRYIQVTEFEIGDDAIPYCQQIETNFEHTLDGMQFNGGISPLLGSDKDKETGLVISNKWRWFNITPGAAGWYTLNDVPFDRAMFGSGKRVRIVSEFIRNDNKMTHAAVTINGVRYAINRTSVAKPVPTWGPHIQHGFQLDTKSTPRSYSVKVWDMEVRAL